MHLILVQLIFINVMAIMSSVIYCQSLTMAPATLQRVVPIDSKSLNVSFVYNAESEPITVKTTITYYDLKNN